MKFPCSLRREFVQDLFSNAIYHMLAPSGPAKGAEWEVGDLLETFPKDHHVLGGLAYAGQPAKRCAASALHKVTPSVGAHILMNAS